MIPFSLEGVTYKPPIHQIIHRRPKSAIHSYLYYSQSKVPLSTLSSPVHATQKILISQLIPCPNALNFFYVVEMNVSNNLCEESISIIELENITKNQ